MTVENIKIFVNDNYSLRVKELLYDLHRILPNSTVTEEEYSAQEKDESLATIRIHEDKDLLYILIDTFKNQVVFKVINFRTYKDITKTDILENNSSQLVLSKFTTELGGKVAEIFMDIFPLDIQANQVINCSVHKGFVFFRFYRFVLSLSTTKLKNTRTKFQQLGPQMTLRLWRFTEEVDGEMVTTEYKKYVKNKNLL